jgi:hypothetical protein
MEAEQRKSRVKPQHEVTWRPEIELKDGTKPIKGQKEKMNRQKLKKPENKRQMSPPIDQVIRRNR